MMQPIRPTAAAARGRRSTLRRLAGAAAAIAASMPFAAFACSGRLHVEVADSGVYALDHAAIVAQQPGLADCRAADLVLTERGEEVPIRITGDDDGRFGPGARIEWIGQRLHGPQSWFDAYSNVNVYLLGAAAGKHARMVERAAPAARGAAVALQRTRHFEQENLMIRLSDREMKAGDEPDVWQWAKLTPIDPQPFSWTFDLDDADTRARGEATLAIDLRGMSNVPAPPQGGAKAVDHVLHILLNGKQLPVQSWDGRDEERRTLAVPAAWLREKGNELKLEVPQRDGADGNFIVDVVMFNWFELAYPARGDVDATAAAFVPERDGNVVMSARGEAPVVFDAKGGWQRAAAAGAGRFRARGLGDTPMYALTGAAANAPTLVRAVAGDDLRGADGWDYVIVAHPRLIDAIAPLAQFRRDHGHRVLVADVDTVYDEFGGGIAHPAAIRALMRWGMQHWRVKPHYLLLVGDASNDIHHDVRSERLNASAAALRPHPDREEILLPGGLSNMPTTSYTNWAPDLPNRNLIPTWQFPSFEGQSASDNGFAVLDGEGYAPQIAVGRLPVVEPAEVAAIVQKTIDYETHPAPGDWRRDVTMISTDEVPWFKEASRSIAADLGNRGFATRNIYTKQDVADAAVAHAELKQDLDAGNLLVHFLGHGGAFIWRVGPPADLFTLADVSALTNTGRYPMVLAMTCFSAPFDNPTEDSIGERFLREANKGAVAVFAASWSNSPNPTNSKELIAQLLEPGESIGDAILATKRQSSDRTFVEMYNLLGDPALVLKQPRTPLAFMRSGDRWRPQVLVHVPERNFGGNVDVDWVDEAGTTIASQHLEARDARFALPVPAATAAEVRVFASNPRTGLAALGTFALREKPPAPAFPAKPKPPAPVAKASEPPKPAQPRVKLPVRDRLAYRDFEPTRAAEPVSQPPAAHAHAKPADKH